MRDSQSIGKDDSGAYCICSTPEQHDAKTINNSSHVDGPVFEALSKMAAYEHLHILPRQQAKILKIALALANMIFGLVGQRTAGQRR